MFASIKLGVVIKFIAGQFELYLQLNTHLECTIELAFKEMSSARNRILKLDIWQTPC